MSPSKSYSIDRRAALGGLSAGVAGACIGSRAFGAPVGATDLTELAERIRGASAERAFDVAADAIRAGTRWPDLLGAIFLAGVQDIRPGPVGSKLHAVMMVESAFQLAEREGGDAWLPVLWNLEDLKRAQARDRREGDWRLPAAPESGLANEAAARAAFVEAMDAWDVERAERAIVGLCEHADLARTSELIWPYAARCFVDIGHKIIHAVQIVRVLHRIGWRHAQPALRALVLALLHGADGRLTDVYERTRERLAAFPANWLAAGGGPAETEALAHALRGTDAAGAQDVVLAAFEEGLGPETVWGGMRLHASELFHQRPAAATRRHQPVHSVTEVNAFAYTFRATRSEETRRLVTLQAAGWLALLRAAMEERFGPNRTVAAATLDGETPRAYGERMVRLLHERAWQDHQYKYAAALLEEYEHLEPVFAERVLAPAQSYLPSADDALSSVHERSLEALRRAGVRGK